MSDEKTRINGSAKDLCVTLERPVNIPGKAHRPSQTNVFRARERSVKDDVTVFYGLNIGPEHTVVEVSHENIRSVATLGPNDKYEDEDEEDG